MTDTRVYDCTLLTLPRHITERQGNLTVVENGITVPFDVKRVFYLYDVPGGESRGGHSHRTHTQLIVAASGSFSVTVDDGKVKRTFLLNRPYEGLLVPPGIWNDLHDFSSGAVCLVLVSGGFNPDEYARDYHTFLSEKGITNP